MKKRIVILFVMMVSIAQAEPESITAQPTDSAPTTVAPEPLPDDLEPFLLEQQQQQFIPNEIIVEPLPVAPPKPRKPSASAEFIGLPPAMVQLLKQADKAKKQKNYVVASVNLERALRIQPKSAVAYKRLAEIHLAQGRYAEAEQWARKSLQYANFSSYTRTVQFRNSVNALLLRAQSGR